MEQIGAAARPSTKIQHSNGSGRRFELRTTVETESSVSSATFTQRVTGSLLYEQDSSEDHTMQSAYYLCQTQCSRSIVGT